MAVSDANLELIGEVAQSILLGSDTSFIVQNVSNRTLRFKVKDSTVEIPGIIKPLDSVGFNYDIDIWVGKANPDDVTSLYIVKG